MVCLFVSEMCMFKLVQDAPSVFFFFLFCLTMKYLTHVPPFGIRCFLLPLYIYIYIEFLFSVLYFHHVRR